MTPDWTILAEEGVREVADQAARTNAKCYPNTIELEDAQQEALIYLASNAAKMRAILADESKGLRFLHTVLVRGLADRVKTEDIHRSRHAGYDAIEDRADPRFS